MNTHNMDLCSLMAAHRDGTIRIADESESYDCPASQLYEDIDQYEHHTCPWNWNGSRGQADELG